MKKRNVILLAATIGLMLTACGDSKESTGNISDSTTVPTDTAENETTEKFKESQESQESQEPENLRTALLKLSCLKGLHRQICRFLQEAL